MKYIAVLDSENEFTEEVINALKDTAFLGDNPQYVFEMLSIEKQERKHGKWKRKIIDSGYNSVWVCSECKRKIQLECHGFKYCPNCGADMRGENND